MSRILSFFFIFFLNRSILVYLFLRSDSRRTTSISTARKDNSPIDGAEGGYQITTTEDVKLMLSAASSRRLARSQEDARQ
jgi:hypothetical protein